MKFKKIFFISLILFSIISCKSNRPSPQDIAQFYKDVYYSDVEGVKEAKRKFPDIIHWYNNFGEQFDISYAHLAAVKNNLEILKLVTDKSNATCFYKPFHETPFMWAVHEGNSPECVEYLMTYEQNYEIVNCYDRNFLHLFIDSESLNLDTWNLIKPKINSKILNQRDVDNHTPLQYLVIQLFIKELYDSDEFFTIFSDLLEIGAKPMDLFEEDSYSDEYDNSFVQLIRNGNLNLYLQELLKHINGSIPDYDKTTSIILVAYYYQNFDIIPYLIPHIENINLCTKSNDTVLHWTVNYIVKNGADKNFIKLLLDAGCDKSIVDADGFTAYSLYEKMCQNPDPEILNLLKID